MSSQLEYRPCCRRRRRQIIEDRLDTIMQTSAPASPILTAAIHSLIHDYVIIVLTQRPLVVLVEVNLAN